MKKELTWSRCCALLVTQGKGIVIGLEVKLVRVCIIVAIGDGCESVVVVVNENFLII